MHYLIIIFLTLSLAAQEFKMSGFRIPNFDEKGKLESVIQGKKAVQKYDKTYLEQVHLSIFDEAKTQIKTPRCVFFKFDRKISSKEKLFLKSLKMDLSGEGFSYDSKLKILHVHQKVEIYLKQPKGEKE